MVFLYIYPHLSAVASLLGHFHIEISLAEQDRNSVACKLSAVPREDLFWLIRKLKLHRREDREVCEEVHVLKPWRLQMLDEVGEYE